MFIGKRNLSKSMDDDFLQGLFIDLSDPIRRQIISTLHNTNSKQQSDLKEILDVNDQELGRNLKRLEERNLIKVNRHSGRPGNNEDRKCGNEISLSILGQWLYPQLSAIMVFDKHKQYFTDHSSLHLPAVFRQNINIILNSPFQIVEGYTNVCQKWIEMYRNTDHGQYIHAAKSEVSLNMIYESFEAIYFRNVKYKYILQKNFRGSKDRREKLKRLRWEKLIYEGRIERGMLEDIPVVVILNEKEAAISFPKDGKANIDKCLYSKDPLFHQWCEEYFEYLWKDCLIFRDEWIIEGE
jgi:predicted transcriptional regulator